MNYNLVAAFFFFLAAVVFFLTGNTAMGAVFLAVGAVFVALTSAGKNSRNTRE